MSYTSTKENSPMYCQSEIEGRKVCNQQCDHCKEYYAPIGLKEGDKVCLNSTGSNRVKWEYGTVTKIYNTPSMLGECWITTVEGYKIIEYLINLKKI